MQGECEVCGRRTAKVFRHHQVPAAKGGRSGPVRLCCRTCSRQVHMLFSEAELAAMGWEELLATPQMRRYVQWVRKRPGDFPTKRSNRLKRR